MTYAIDRLTLAGSCLAALLLMTVPLCAQVPDEFTNLKVLDNDIGKQDLIGIMKGWAGGLGVRCNHCHVGPDNLQGMDFATDEKEHKRATRAMVEMVRTINSQYLGSWKNEAHEGEAGDDGVTCFTCHRGQPKPPHKLSDVLTEAALNEGSDAAMNQYESLKEEHYGAGLYDFSEGTFGQVAQAAIEAGKPEVGLEILRSSLEVYPESADLHAFLGMGLVQSGDADGAAEAFAKALQLDPDNANAKRGNMMLERMGN
jgi:tetratricopeptide (TPR) repeat protein